MFEKIDGLRVLWNGTCFKTENEKIIIPPKNFQDNLPYDQYLDGFLR